MMPDLRRSALFFAVSFVQALDNQLVPVLLPVLRTEMGGAPAGQMLTAYALACGAVPLLATLILRTRRVRALTMTALAVMGVAALVFAATTSFPVRLAARAAAGASSGVLSMTLLLAASQIPEERSRAHQFTVINAGYLTALVLGVPIGAVVAGRFDVRSVYDGIGALAFVLCALALAFRSAGAAQQEQGRPSSMIRLFRHRQPALILLATGLVGAAMAGPVGSLGSFLSAERGLTVDAIGAVYMWAGVGPLLAMPISGRTIARWRPHRVAIAGSLLMAAPLALFPQLAASLATAAAVMLACVFVETIRRAALQGSLAEAALPADLPRYLALRGVIVQLGLAIGYALAEAQYRHSGFELVCAVAAGLSVAAAGVLVTAGAPAAARPVHPS
jgi:DHA1 family putative efflux transporter-like MFS transporter